MSERIFFAGATGVLGRDALPMVLQAGHEVTAAARTAEKRTSLEQLDAQAVVLRFGMLYGPATSRRRR